MRRLRRLTELCWTVLKLTGLMLAETVFTALFVAVPIFFICYTCDMCFGEHLLVRTADKCYWICLCAGLGAGLVATWLSTAKIRKNMLRNHAVK